MHCQKRHGAAQISTWIRSVASGILGLHRVDEAQLKLSNHTSLRQVSSPTRCGTITWKPDQELLRIDHPNQWSLICSCCVACNNRNVNWDKSDVWKQQTRTEVSILFLRQNAQIHWDLSWNMQVLCIHEFLSLISVTQTHTSQLCQVDTQAIDCKHCKLVTTAILKW